MDEQGRVSAPDMHLSERWAITGVVGSMAWKFTGSRLVIVYTYAKDKKKMGYGVADGRRALRPIQTYSDITRIKAANKARKMRQREQQQAQSAGQVRVEDVRVGRRPRGGRFL